MTLTSVLHPTPSTPGLQHPIPSHRVMAAIDRSFSAMVSGDGSLARVEEMTEALLETPAYDLLAQQLNRDPACAALIQSRYIPPAHDLDRLLTYPQESLGYLYAAAMKRAGYDPNLQGNMRPESDAEYVEFRLSQTHDIWHIVTGFGTSEIDEIGLQAVHLSQFPYPLAAVLIASSLMSSVLLDPDTLSSLQAAIARGLQMGRSARSLFAQKWEEGFEKPLEQWRQELNIQPL